MADSSSPLHAAVKKNNIKLVRTLLAAKADVNKIFRGKTPLNVILAKIGKDKPVQFEIVKELLDAGADVNAANDQSLRTPLHFISKLKTRNGLSIAELLLEKGAVINAQDSAGNTPLHYAAGANWIEMVKLLLYNLADVHIENKDGYNPLFYTFFYNVGDDSHLEVRKIFFDFGLDVDYTDDNGRTIMNMIDLAKDIKSVKCFYRLGVSFNAPEYIGRPPLLDFMDKCLELGVLEDIPEEREMTPEDEDLCSLDADYVMEPFDRLDYILKRTNPDLLFSEGGNIVDLTPKIRIWMRIVLQHIAKLKICGVPVDESILDSIFERTIFRRYFEKCIEELTTAKCTKLQGSWISFLDLLVEDTSKLIKYAGNKSLVEDFVKCNVIQKFPIYGEAMKKKFSKATEKRKVWDDAAITLSDHLPIFHPTHLIIRSLLDCLTNSDLRKFCEKELAVTDISGPTKRSKPMT